MDKADILIQKLEPEIDAKCNQIKQKRNEKLLTKVFVLAAALMLTVPTLLILLGISLLTVLIPLIFIGAVFLAASPVLMSKGAECYE